MANKVVNLARGCGEQKNARASERSTSDAGLSRSPAQKEGSFFSFIPAQSLYLSRNCKTGSHFLLQSPLSEHSICHALLVHVSSFSTVLTQSIVIVNSSRE